MFSFFGGGNNISQSKKNKKKGKKEQSKQIKEYKNPIKLVLMNGYSLVGAGPKKQECQDAFYCMTQENMNFGSDKDCYFCGVYDGHGSSGKEASQAASDYIWGYIEKKKDTTSKLKTDKDRESFLREAFKVAEDKLKQSGIDYSNSGTCAICVYIQQNTAYIANLGDSRAVLYRRTPKEKLAIELSWDHKPIRQEEKDRIHKCGGKIERLVHDGKPVGPLRVWADDEGPGIAMTRTLGDLQAKKIGLISDPEIQHIEINNKTDRFIVLGSDGLWDVMTSGDVVGYVDHILQTDNKINQMEINQIYQKIQEAADGVVGEAKKKWDILNNQKKTQSKIGDVPYLKYGRDDITAVIAVFIFHDEENLQ